MYMMRRMGFNEKWLIWIYICLSSISESPTKEFGLQKGLRQGDPVAPFFFTIVAERQAN